MILLLLLIKIIMILMYKKNVCVINVMLLYNLVKHLFTFLVCYN